MNEPSGWYHAKGDPPGTTRFWDGSDWKGEPHDAPSEETTGSSLAVVSPAVRAAGRIIDWVLLSIVIAPVLAAGESVDGSLLLGLTYRWLAILGVALFLWDTLWIWLLGATPGKFILGFRVLTAGGHESPPGLEAGATRAAHRLVFLIPVVGEILWLWIGAISVGMILTGKTKQSVMDRAARTIVAAPPT
jgi:uncharacterized RDD family membrane protein YckC